MVWFWDNDNEVEDRSHQDNCRWSEIDHEEWDNGNKQYCEFCGAMREFKWDRCITCHNN